MTFTSPRSKAAATKQAAEDLRILLRVTVLERRECDQIDLRTVRQNRLKWGNIRTHFSKNLKEVRGGVEARY